MARKLTRETVRVVPIGGLGEVGKNCTVVEFGNDAVVIDCGITFPDAETFGVDFIIPDFTYLREIRHKLRAFLLTHGHEDHIGALPFALREFRVPVYGSALTLGLLRVKLEEAGVGHEPDLRTVRAREIMQIGAFRGEFFHVCHSIPDAMGVALHTPAGTVVHTGDFKLDHTPVDGIPPDFQTLGRLGEEGVLLLLSDSTYADRPGYTPSERLVAETLDKVFADAPGRIILATFSSLIARVQQVLDAAYAYGRKVAVVGRSMERTFRVATELGYLHLPASDIVIKPEQLDDYGDRDIAILCTGSQGEPRSALARMANRDHRHITIEPGDTVVVSAAAIPGNEFYVNRTIDRLFRQGANVLYERVMPVHVSGHASQEELKFMLTTLQPRFFVPIHGEPRHRVAHRGLAEQVGMDVERIVLAEDGAVIDVTAEDIEIVGQVETGSVFVDGLGVGDVGEAVLRDRRHLAEDGVVVVVAMVDRQTGKSLAEPDIISRGFVQPSDSAELLESAREVVRRAIDAGDHPDPEPDYLQQKIRSRLGRHLFRGTRRRPVILPIVTKV